MLTNTVRLLRHISKPSRQPTLTCLWWSVLQPLGQSLPCLVMISFNGQPSRNFFDTEPFRRFGRYGAPSMRL